MTTRRWIPLMVGFMAGKFASSVLGSDVVVGGGEWQLAGQVECGQLVVGIGSELTGNGTIVGDLFVAGDLSPGGGAVGTQTVAGAATFAAGSRFLCDAAILETLDRLDVAGPVIGATTVHVFPAAGAVPVGQIVVVGSPASDYSGFSAADAYTWRLAPTNSLDLALTHLRGDTDGDGLPDWWEMAYFESSRTAAAPDGNPDEDPALNRDEYGANTDPGDGESFLHLTDIRRAASNSSALTWTTAAGRRYAVMSSTNLALPGAAATSAVVTSYAEPLNVWTGATESGQAAMFWISAEENAP